MSSFAVSSSHAFPFSVLKLDMYASDDSLTTGDSITLDIVIEHQQYSAASLEVATNAIVTIDLPLGATNLTSQDCTQIDMATMECVLPELPVGSIINISAGATFNIEGYRQVIASLQANDIFGGPQVEKEHITVESPMPSTSAVDLELVLTTNNHESYVLESGYITAVVKNLHPTNTAFFPTVDLVIPESYGFKAQDGCVFSAGIATCNVFALPPESESKTVFALNGITPASDVTSFGSVSSTQPDIDPLNNKSQLVTSIVSTPALSCGSSDVLCASLGNSTYLPRANEKAAGSDRSTRSGGGALTVWLLFLLMRTFILHRQMYKSKTPF